MTLPPPPVVAVPDVTVDALIEHLLAQRDQGLGSSPVQVCVMGRRGRFPVKLVAAQPDHSVLLYGHRS